MGQLRLPCEPGNLWPAKHRQKLVANNGHLTICPTGHVATVTMHPLAARRRCNLSIGISLTQISLRAHETQSGWKIRRPQRFVIVWLSWLGLAWPGRHYNVGGKRLTRLAWHWWLPKRGRRSAITIFVEFHFRYCCRRSPFFLST